MGDHARETARAPHTTPATRLGRIAGNGCAPSLAASRRSANSTEMTPTAQAYGRIRNHRGQKVAEENTDRERRAPGRRGLVRQSYGGRPRLRRRPAPAEWARMIAAACTGGIASAISGSPSIPMPRNHLRQAHQRHGGNGSQVEARMSDHVRRVARIVSGAAGAAARERCRASALRRFVGSRGQEPEAI